MGNPIQFFHCRIRVDFRNKDFKLSVVRKAIEKSGAADEPPFLSFLAEQSVEPGDHPESIGLIAGLCRKFLRMTRLFKAKKNGP